MRAFDIIEFSTKLKIVPRKSYSNEESEINDISKVIRTAIKMEEGGIDFYQKVREKTFYPLARKMFLSFAEDEKIHLTVLKAGQRKEP